MFNGDLDSVTTSNNEMRFCLLEFRRLMERGFNRSEFGKETDVFLRVIWCLVAMQNS